MNIAILAAGAGGMYCGSCLRDNALASALMRLGQKVVLVPLYTPLRTDTKDVSISQVFMGGVNAWLQHASAVFRHTPRAFDWLFDRPWLLNWAGKRGAQTSPAKLGPFILSVLQGDRGPQVKEIRRLARFLKEDFRPDLVSLPNAMFLGLARMLRQETGAPVVCELTGEDIFLDAMAEPYRSQAQAIIRERARDVAGFVATSRFYAERMSRYLGVPADAIKVVHPGIDRAHLDGVASDAADVAARPPRPPTVGYFARICPEKGIDHLVEAMTLLRRMPGMEGVRLRAAGFLGEAHRAWFADLLASKVSAGLGDAFEHVGEVDLAGKLAFLDSIDVLSVPAAYAEPKGMYLLEAMARGVPVVQPRHGAFPELVEATGGGVLVEHGSPQALAEGLAELLRDARRRAELGARGRAAVAAAFTDEHMAQKMLTVYEELRA